MAGTIGSVVTQQVTLTIAQYPLTITSTGAVEVPLGTAIYGPNTQFWAITNAGTVSGGGNAGAIGIDLEAGGSIDNSGLISGSAEGVRIAGQSGTVSNSGTISGAVTGIGLLAGGTISDYGLISGGTVGVFVSGGDGTVIDAGTISGGVAGGAVQFAGTYSDRLILDAGAVLDGGVTGGTGINVLELAPGVTAGVVGTLSGFGADITGFQIILVDAGADWLVDSTDTIGVPLADFGTLTNTGTDSAGIYLFNAASLNNTGIIKIAPGFEAILDYTGAATVTNSGTIQAGITGGTGIGVLLAEGGLLTNTATGLIAAGYYGVVITSAAGTVVNAGTIRTTGTLGTGVVLSSGNDTLVNSGTVGGAELSVYLASGGSVTNSGLIGANSVVYNPASHSYGMETTAAAVGILVGGGNYATAATVTNAGTIRGSTDAILFIGTTGFAGRVIADPGAVFVGAVVGATASGGTNVLELAAGPSGVSGTLAGFGTQFINFTTIDEDSGASWRVGGTFAAADGVTMLGTGDTLTIANLASFAASIAGFGTTDTIHVADVVANRATLIGHTLELFDNNSEVGSLDLIGAFTHERFTATPDGTGGTVIDLVPCFVRGTRVLTDEGEQAVESLGIGDRLITRSGVARPIKWIGRRSYAGWLAAGNPKVLPICFKAGALADHVPSRDLFVSPEHAMVLDDVLVPAGLLVNGVSILKTGPADEVHYFHLELEDHDVIFAEGAATESFVDDHGRGMFNNAAEFAALYPAAARGTARYCAPRIEEGYALEALRRRLAGRAKWLLADGTAMPGSLEGQIDLVRHDLIEGWARDPATPGCPVALRVFANGAEIGRVVADQYRRDLREAGIGTGCHAFSLAVPGSLAPDRRHAIAVWREDDGVELRRSPAVLEPVTGACESAAHESGSLPVPLGKLRGHLDEVGRRRIAGWAQDDADRERPVGLVVTANGAVIGRTLANRYRDDLEGAGVGSGRHAFELVFPTILPGEAAQQIRVLREADGAEMPGSPVILPASDEADELGTLRLLTQEVDRLLARRAAREGGAARAVLHSYRRRWGNAAAASDDGARGTQRALVVDLLVPCAARDAGSVAILSHMRALRALGYAVSFAAADEMRNETALARLAADEGIVTCGMPFYAGIEDVLCRQGENFDLVYLHRMDSADRYLPLVRRHASAARVVYSVADLHHLRIGRQAKIEGRPELMAHARTLAEVEIAAARRADLVLTHSAVEAELLRRSVRSGKVHVVPFAAPPRLPCAPFAERQGVTVLGSFGHAPNQDAVHHLIRDVLPLVWARDPAITCQVIGHGWDAGRLPGVDPRVAVPGPVADLDAALGQARLSVAPLRFGAGLKGKVLDSLATGLPCVMTPIAAEGLELTGALSGLVGADAAALAELILWLHADQDANDRIGALGRHMVAEGFCQETVTRRLGQVLVGEPAENRTIPALSAAS